MRKSKLFLVFLIFLLSGNLFAQSGWQWINPIPQGNEIEKVKFYNDNTGYAVCRGYTVIKTTNGGENWVSVSNGIRSLLGPSILDGILTSLYIINENTVIAGGNGIIKTTNGGINWFSIGGDITSVIGISFANSTTGFAATSPGKLYKTTNQGTTWSLAGTYGIEMTAIYFSSEQSGVFATRASGNAVIYSTSNSGATWTQVYSVAAFFIHNFDFINSTTGYAVVDNSSVPGKLLKTTNGGENWQVLRNLPFGVGSDNNFEMVSEQTGFIYTNLIYGTFRRTTNEGQTWDSINIRNAFTYGPYALTFKNAFTGFAMGRAGSIYHTTNAGTNWTCRSSQWDIMTSFNYVKFFDEDNAVILGGGNILKTSNAGANWNLYKANCDFVSAHFLNSLTGYSQARDSLVKTTNGGINWSLVGNGVFPNGLGSIYFFDESTGFVGDGLGKIFRTTNGGVNWSSQTLNSTIDYNSVSGIQFLDSQTGYLFNAHQQVCGLCPPTYTHIYKTTNAGINWSLHSTLSNVYFGRMKFISNNLAFASAIDGIYTLNGSWSKIINLVNGGHALDFLPPSTITVEDYRTTDLGINWIPQEQLCDNIYNIAFANQNTGFIVGSGGAILKTTTGGVFVVDIINLSSEVPENFSLSQNYPNPFNPTTVIRYQLSVPVFTTLKIFDLLGKEVASLVNENQNAGSYAVDFNSSEYNLPSGIYFYTLNAGEFKETRKMILIK
jgi:photosystem II stability/assembly factor-like uncharacterized protein